MAGERTSLLFVWAEMMVPSARENLYRGLRAWPFLNTEQREKEAEMSINLRTINEGDLKRVHWLTILLVFLSEGHLAIVLQVKPLNAPPDQVLPAWFHGRTKQTGVQRCYFAWMYRKARVTPVNVMERNRNSYRNNMHLTLSYLEGPVS